MGFFRDYWERRKQKKLEKSLEERKNTFIHEALGELDSAIGSDAQPSEKMEKIVRILETKCTKAITLGIIGQDEGIEELANALGNKPEYQEAITNSKKIHAEDMIYYEFKSGEIGISEILLHVDDYIKDFHLMSNEWQVVSTKEKNDLLKQIIEAHAPNEEEKNLDFKNLEKRLKTYYVLKISDEKNPQAFLQLYQEFIRDCINEDPQKVEEFRECFKMYCDPSVLRKIDALREIGTGISFDSVDMVPVLYDGIDPKENVERNEKIAEKLRFKDITAEQLLFIRKAHTFPLDRVVEPIGEYSGMEPASNPFESVLLKKGIDVKDYEILVPRYRATSHWCINGIVGDHAGNCFDGDLFIIEEASEHKDDSQLLNMRPEDTFFLGDLKLSPKSKIMMSVEKYKELLQDPKMKKQLERIKVVLFKENPNEALKCYMNDNGYVWGDISAWGYALGRGKNKEAQTDYLSKLTYSIEHKKVQGFEMCASVTDEGLMIEYVKNPESKEKMRETISKAYEKRGWPKPETIGEEFQFRNVSRMMDDYLAEVETMEFLSLLESKFPDKQAQIQKLTKLYKKGISQSNNDTVGKVYDACAQELAEEIGLENILEVTKEFNQSQRKKEVEYRKRKDKELLEKGLITEEEYGDRDDDDVIYS